MAIKVVECLDWPAKDRVGELLRFAERFKRDGVDLDALWAFHPGSGAPKIAAIAKAPAKLAASLKALGVKPNRSRCFYMSGTDGAGVLVAALRALAGAGINVACADAVAGGGKYGATLWVAEGDLARAKAVLKAR